MSSNGSQPRPPIRRLPGSRRVHLAVGFATAVLLVGVLVAPVVLLGGRSGKPASCRLMIFYKGRRYDARVTGRIVEAIAVGVGVAHGCGNAPTNVDLRSVAGLKVSLAVAIASNPSTAYVQRGVCPGLARKALLRCLKARVAVVATGSLPQ